MPAGAPGLITRELLERAWDMRPVELGPVELFAPRVMLPVMRFEPPGAHSRWWESLCASWQKLPPHPHILELAGYDGQAARLQFALLDWRPSVVDAVTRQHQAAQLASAFAHVGTHVEPAQWWLFSRARAFVDLDGAIRVAFLPPVAPPGPVDLERVVAATWFAFCPRETVIITSTEKVEAVRAFADLEAWRALELGIGLLLVDRPDAARPNLQRAERLWPWSSLVKEALAACDGELALVEALDHEADAVEALHWAQRDPAFGELYRFDDGRIVPAVLYDAGFESEHWPALRAAWRELPIHDVLLDALAVHTDGRLVLRFAAIVWSTPVEGRHALALAGQLTSVLQHVVRWVPADRWWLFLEPCLYLDLAGHLRVSFSAPMKKARGAVSEATFVELVALLLLELSEGATSKVRATLEQCLDRSRRFASLALLAAELEGPTLRRRGERQWDAWRRAEEGLGLLLLDRPADAREAFEWADFTRSTVLTRWGRSRCDRLLGPRPANERVQHEGWAPEPWSAVEARIADLEAQRDFLGALRLYELVEPTPENRTTVWSARARCHLEARQPQLAIDWAQRALAAARVVSPSARGAEDAHRILIRALIEHRALAEALRQVELLVRHAPHDAVAHYLRGNALLGLRRLDEARDAFDLAIALRPTLAEALLLRREADRLLVALGKHVGRQQVTLHIPPSLESLRETLLGGRARAIFEALSAPSLATNADAQLMLARFLGFDGQHERALAIYERLTDGPHRAAALVGKAASLRAKGSLASALALLDATVAESPQDLDACEERARVLDALGRHGEAAAEFRRFVQLGTARSDVRVRAAQLWLDAH